MSEDTKEDISINKNEVVSFTRKQIYRSDNMPHYRRIGIMNSSEETDIIDLLGNVSKSAYQMFIMLKNSRNEDNNLSSLPSCSDHSKISAQTRSLRELEKAGLVKKVKTTELRTTDRLEMRVPKRTYILNPKHLFPRTNEGFEVSLYYWDQLK